jgi:hypothetical protein
MYLAKIGGEVHIKRMPGSGADHAQNCDSYDPPVEISGLGQVFGTAIQDDPRHAGLTALRLDFSLTRQAGRAAPAVISTSTPDTATSDGTKLSLRSLLHYLWDDAGFTRWSPAMAGKRTWHVIRKYLLDAAACKTTKGSALSDILYVPEPFLLDRKDEIAQRRLAIMSKAAAQATGPRRLMLLIAEVKEIGASRYGHTIVFRHLPDCHFMVEDGLHRRMVRRFEAELGLWDAHEETHLMAIGTFSVSTSGVPSMEELALMLTTENWVPFEHAAERLVIDAMTHAHRRFTKTLRYNLPASKPLASLVASDTTPGPTAMFVLPPGASEQAVEEIAELMSGSSLATWSWRSGDEPMPEIPAVGTGSVS